ncbi:hypothetical protein [Micromonospora sp. CA-244673]|uniref:hypothetical protein n=1 Tax=Micromonospora sp. CA-244673 TaxID=3239958 RepID=UPI003D945541
MSFYVCASNYWPDCYGSPAWTSGDIAWLNRSATLAGDVYDHLDGGTTAIFEAMVSGNSKPVAIQTRFADDTNPKFGTQRSFSFTMTYDVPGGFDRIRITVCKNYQQSNQICSPQYNYWR